MPREDGDRVVAAVSAVGADGGGGGLRVVGRGEWLGGFVVGRRAGDEVWG